jgi:hypothetical protein
MKTAVEWLVDEIKIQQQMYIDLAKKNKSLKKEVDAILTASTLIIMKSEQAKEMENEQHKKTYFKGWDSIGNRDEDFEQYYNQTFKQQEQ